MPITPRQQYNKDPSQLDAAKRNQIRQQKYNEGIRSGKSLEKWMQDPSRRDPSGYTKIPTATGVGDRYVKIQATDLNLKNKITADDGAMPTMRAANPNFSGNSEGKGRVAYQSSDGMGNAEPLADYEFMSVPYRTNNKYSIVEEDQAWAQNARALNSSAYRNPVKQGAGGNKRSQGASTFTVGERSALGEGGKEAARSATLTTTGAASGTAKAAAAAKRKLR